MLEVYKTCSICFQQLQKYPRAGNLFMYVIRQLSTPTGRWSIILESGSFFFFFFLLYFCAWNEARVATRADNGPHGPPNPAQYWWLGKKFGPMEWAWAKKKSSFKNLALAQEIKH